MFMACTLWIAQLLKSRCCQVSSLDRTEQDGVNAMICSFNV